MRLIWLAVILTLGLALAPLVAETQQAGKVYRIGKGCATSDTSRDRIWSSSPDTLKDKLIVSPASLPNSWA